MKVSVLGCGRWGSFIAWYLSKKGKEVYLWGLEGTPLIKTLMENRKNDLLEYDDSIIISDDLDNAVKFADVFVISISSQALDSFTKRLNGYDMSGKTIVLCMKGIEENTGRRLTQIVEDNISSKPAVAIWVGPGHVQDFSSGIPNCMVIDSKNEETKQFLVDSFSSDLIRMYYGNDLVGNEVGAASKNVIGIAAGMLDGMNLSSLKGALMTRGAREISRLIKAMGGNELSAYGLCHLGDYEATVFSKHSHNRLFGELIIKKEPYNSLAEGYATSAAMMVLSKKYNVDLPICCAVYEVLYENKEPVEAMKDLFSREKKTEFYN